MNSVLDRFAHNFIIDELVYWPPIKKRVSSIHSRVPNVGNCSVSIKYDDTSEYVVQIEREHFEETWNEACAVLKAVTTISGDFSPLTKAEISSLEVDRQRWIRDAKLSLSREALRVRDEALEKAIVLFKSGDYEAFLEQFGENYIPLPDPMVKRIELAKRKIKDKQ